MKRFLPYLLAVYFAFMLVVPGYFVYRHYDTLNYGESYKFVVVPYDPYDPFRGRYVALYTEDRPHTRYDENGKLLKYAVLHKNDNGNTTVVEFTAKKPSSGAYVKNLQLDRYYMNEKMAFETERLQRDLDFDLHTMHLLVRVKNGHYVIEGLYLDDVAIEQYITAEAQ